jgi:hypothetical protein
MVALQLTELPLQSLAGAVTVDATVPPEVVAVSW